MSLPAKPENTDDAVSQLWFVVIGMNGDGLVSKVNRLVELAEGREIAEAEQRGAVKGNERRKVSLREWVLIAATAVPTSIYLAIELAKGVH